jgi:hypothetical protein
MKQSPMFTLLFVLCVGCNDINVRQQQAEEARKQQTANELRAIGEKMHNAPANESAADPVATGVLENMPDSSPK